MFILTFYIIFTLIQISYWILFYFAFTKISRKKKTTKTKHIPISIIVCFKNEAENLKHNFQYWATQLLDDDELILVNDFSTDDSLQVAQNLTTGSDNITILNVSSDFPGKKQALTEGVEAARTSIILVTDADCVPNPEWRKTVANQVEENTDFVLGYGPIKYASGVLNLFQRFECVMTALQYFSYASFGFPYMGVGRNMLFRRSIFDRKIYRDKAIASGDDDMLVSAKANSKNTKLCIDSSSFVTSEGTKSWRSYFKQKARHVSSSVVYKPAIKFLLGLFATCQILILPLFIVLLFTSYFRIAILLCLLRLFVIFIVLLINGNKLKAHDLFIYTPVLDTMLSIYYLLLGFLSFTNNKSRWN